MLQSIGLQRVGHDLVTETTLTSFHFRRLEEKTKPKTSRRNEILSIRAAMNEIEDRKWSQQNQKLVIQDDEQIDKPLIRLMAEDSNF